MEVYNFDFNSGFFEKSNNVLKQDDIHTFAILNINQAKMFFQKRNIPQFIKELSKHVIQKTEEDKLSFDNPGIFYSGENGIYYRSFLTEIITPIETKNTCNTDNTISSYCAGVLPTHNIFSFELPGFRVHELGIFMSNDSMVIICDTKNTYVLEKLREFMNETFFVLGPAFIALSLLDRNSKQIKELIENYNRLGTEFIEQIIKLKYKQIENFNFIINKYESNLINLVNYIDINNTIIQDYNSNNYPFFSNFIKGRKLSVDTAVITQSEFFNKEKGGFLLSSPNTLKQVNEFLQNLNQSRNENSYQNGILGEKGTVNYDTKKINTKKPCVCDEEDYIINRFRFKGSGNFIKQIPNDVCVVKNPESCKQAFQYKNSKYYISLSNNSDKPISFSIELYNTYYDKLVKDYRELKRETSELVDKSDQILTRSFDRLEFYNSRNMSILTIISAIFLPTSFLAGWYGMNVPNIPEFTRIYSYPIIALLTIMIIIGYLYFYKDILFLQEVEYKRVTPTKKNS